MVIFDFNWRKIDRWLSQMFAYWIKVGKFRNFWFAHHLQFTSYCWNWNGWSRSFSQVCLLFQFANFTVVMTYYSIEKVTVAMTTQWRYSRSSSSYNEDSDDDIYPPGNRREPSLGCCTGHTTQQSEQCQSPVHSSWFCYLLLQLLILLQISSKSWLSQISSKSWSFFRYLLNPDCLRYLTSFLIVYCTTLPDSILYHSFCSGNCSLLNQFWNLSILDDWSSKYNH